MLDGAAECAANGHLSSLHPQNLRAADALSPGLADHPAYPLLFDPQTAGGLLASVPAERVPGALHSLAVAECQPVVIGRVLERRSQSSGVVLVRSFSA